MPIIRNLRKDFDEGRMDNLRSQTYEGRGTKSPYVTKSQGSDYDEFTKRVDDLTRISKLLIDRPGLKHLANEAILKQGELTKKLESNPAYQNGSAVGNIIRRTGGTIKHVAQVAASTVAQVPVNGTGTHFLRAFRNDTYLQDTEVRSGVAQFFGAGGVEGAQYALKGERVPSLGVNNGSFLPSRNTTANPGDVGQLHIGIEGKLTSITDISAYASNFPYYSDQGEFKPSPHAIIGNTSIGYARPTFESEFIQTTLLRGGIGVDKSATGAVSEFGGKLSSNPNLITNTYSPDGDKEFLGSKTEKNTVLANIGFPINPGLTVEGFTDGNLPSQDLFIPTSFTTARSGSLGVSNKISSGSVVDPLPERSTITPFNAEQSAAGGGRTAISTLDNINRSRVGARIPLLGAPTRPLDFYAQNGIVTLFNTGDEQFKEYITTGYAPVELRKKLIDLNTGEDGTGIGSITSLSKQFTQKYSDLEGASYIQQSTETNNITVQVGAPITNNSVAGPTPDLNTTSFKGGIPGSTTNRGISGSITGLPMSINNKYNDGGRGFSYLAHSTERNITAIQSGFDFIDIGGATRPADGTIPVRSNSWIDGIKFTSKKITDTRVGGDVNKIELDGEYFSGNAQNGISSFDPNKSSTSIQDFRSQGQVEDLPPASDNYSKFRTVKTYAFDYSDKLINKETRVGLGNPGKISRARISYTTEDSDTRDKINYLDVSDKPLDGISENRDLIQLEFQIMTPDQTHYLAFRAFLDTFDDNYTGNWNSSRYLGRADNFYTYGGFERSINIGFKIAAQTREEMKPLYRKAATLASVTAPTYGQGGRFMRGSIAKVTVGDYIYEQPGIIESVQYTWQKDYPWEISFQNPEGGDNSQILPHVLDVSLSFKVIHDFLPETGINPFITNYRPIQENKDVYIPLQDRKFVIPETKAEKEQKKSQEEGKKSEEKKKTEDKLLQDTGASGPLQSGESYNSLGGDTETTFTPEDLRANIQAEIENEVSQDVGFPVGIGT